MEPRNYEIGCIVMNFVLERKFYFVTQKLLVTNMPLMHSILRQHLYRTILILCVKINIFRQDTEGVHPWLTEFDDFQADSQYKVS